MPLSVADIKAGDVLAGKFRVVRKLGEGGMGAVFEIEHLLTKHHRALKLLHGAAAKSAAVVQRFLREASAAGHIGNPHITEVFDAGMLDTGEPYLVMEFLRGSSLSGLLERRGGRLEQGELVELLGQACEGVAAAHDAGVIHRDLKPDNLFVTERDGKPFVKVIDFGISKFDASLEPGQPVTREGSMLGTPYYMSPEQFRGEGSIDGRADVYSLGIILYECACGRRPYEGETLPELVLQIAEGTPQAPSARRPELAGDFERLILRAMAADRTRRPASVRELQRELRAFAQPSQAAAGLAETQAAPTAPSPVAPASPTAATMEPVSTSPPGEVPAPPTQPVISPGRSQAGATLAPGASAPRGSLLAAGAALLVAGALLLARRPWADEAPKSPTQARPEPTEPTASSSEPAVQVVSAATAPGSSAPSAASAPQASAQPGASSGPCPPCPPPGPCAPCPQPGASRAGAASSRGSPAGTSRGQAAGLATKNPYGN